MVNKDLGTQVVWQEEGVPFVSQSAPFDAIAGSDGFQWQPEAW